MIEAYTKNTWDTYIHNIQQNESEQRKKVISVLRLGGYHPSASLLARYLWHIKPEILFSAAPQAAAHPMRDAEPLHTGLDLLLRDVQRALPRDERFRPRGCAGARGGMELVVRRGVDWFAGETVDQVKAV